MDLIHEEDVILLQIGEQGRQIAWLLDGRAGGDADIDPHLVGNDTGQGGLTQARRAVEQDMVQRLAAQLCRPDENFKVALGFFLPDVLRQRFGPQGALPLILRGESSGHQRREVLRLDPLTGKINGQSHLPPYFTIFFRHCLMICSSVKLSRSRPFRAMTISCWL